MDSSKELKDRERIAKQIAKIIGKESQPIKKKENIARIKLLRNENLKIMKMMMMVTGWIKHGFNLHYHLKSNEKNRLSYRIHLILHRTFIFSLS